MAGFDGDVHIEVARGIRTAVESEGGHFRPFGEFRKRLAAAGIHVSSTIASKLWRAVDESSEHSEEEEEEEVKDGVPEPQSAQDQPEDVDQGLSLLEIEESHFYPIEHDATLESLEERMSQGLAAVLRVDYEAAEKRMLILLQQAHFYCEVRKMGLSVSQVRTLLKGMAPKVKESVEAFAYRYSSAHAVYIRLAGPSGFEESLKTKGRRLLTAAGLPVPAEFLGPDVSLFSGRSPKAELFQSPSAGTPPRRQEHFIGTPFDPAPPFPAFRGFATPQQEDPVKVASIFQVKPQVTLPKMGNKDHDVEAHMEEFEDLCNLANPK